MSFYQKLRSAWESSRSLVCVGLDPDLKSIPRHLQGEPDAIFRFNQAIIDATHDLVCAYKPQIAYYAAHRAEDQLERTIRYIRERNPGVVVILDSKRGDIGSTAEMYAREAFDRFEADAVTVNPYLGGDSIEPFLKRKDKGTILLCRTSNPGGQEIQDLDVRGERLYQLIARKAAKDWNRAGNIALVVGATYPQELRAVREIVGDEVPFLVPGVGAQGGDVCDAVCNGKNRSGTGLIISSSRAIIYAGSGMDFGEAARQAAVKLRDEIRKSSEAKT